MKKYNVNELLEHKKELEAQIDEKRNVDVKDLTYIEEEILDHVDNKNNRKIIPRTKVTLNEFTQVFNGLTEELAKVKVAIQKHNAEQVVEKLQQRDMIRKKIDFLNNIKTVLPREMQKGRKILTQGKEGETLESVTTTNEGMFDIKIVEIQLNQLASQERKLNTEIQRINLDADIDLDLQKTEEEEKPEETQ